MEQALEREKPDFVVFLKKRPGLCSRNLLRNSRMRSIFSRLMCRFFKRKWVGELGQKEKQNDGQEAAIVIQNGDNDGGNYNDCSGRNRNGQI